MTVCSPHPRHKVLAPKSKGYPTVSPDDNLTRSEMLTERDAKFIPSLSTGDELPSAKQIAANIALSEKEEEAAARLQSLQHINPQRQGHEGTMSADLTLIAQPHGKGNNACGDEAPVVVHDWEMQLPVSENVRENSGSSDVSAARFSADSDLTAEQPVAGVPCVDDDNECGDAAMIGNSGSSSSSSSSNPLHHRSNASFNGYAGTGHQNPSSSKVAKSNCRISKELKIGHRSEMPSAPTTSTAWEHRQPKTPKDDHNQVTLMASIDRGMVCVSQEYEGRQQVDVSSNGRQCSSNSLAGHAECGVRNLTESWLELRLSPYDVTSANMALTISDTDRISDETKWRLAAELTDDVVSVETGKRTLQLLPPERPERLLPVSFPLTEMQGQPAWQEVRPSATPLQYVVGAMPCAFKFVPFSVPASAPDSFRSHVITRGAAAEVPNDGSSCPDLLHGSMRNDLCAASGSHCSQQVMQSAIQGNNNRHFHNSTYPGVSSSSYNQYIQNGTIGERRSTCVGSPEASGDMSTIAAAQGVPMMISNTVTTASRGEYQRPVEIYRPTASFGWASAAVAPADGSALHWSASNTYNSKMQVSRGMSWQGLLRSMANDPQLLHTPYAVRDQISTAPHKLGGCVTISQSTPALGLQRRNITTLPPLQATETRPSITSHPVRTSAAYPAGGYRRRRLAIASRRRTKDLWFSLQEGTVADDRCKLSSKQEQHHLSSNTQKLYLRIRDDKMQISVLKNYLIKKLGSAESHQHHPDEVDITCRGELLSPSLTMQHVHDRIWLKEDMELHAIGFKCTSKNQTYAPLNGVMALFYQLHYTSQNLTLNLLRF